MKSMTSFILTSLVAIVLISCNPSSNVTTTDSSSSEPALSERIDAAISNYFADDKPGIAAIAAIDGEVVFRKGYGLANVELDVPIEPDMVFRIASITKEFTAVLIMQLVEQGELALDDDIIKYLPDFPAKEHTITIRHLLSHTSGLAPFIRLETFQERIREDFTVQEVIDLFKNEPLLFTPGERYSYCSSGYILLGAIAENVTGKTYEEALRENIFDVLDMEHSQRGGNDKIIPGRVNGYTVADGVLANDAIVTMSAAFSSGSLLSSVDDLFRWDEALYSDILLKKDSRELMWTPYVLNNGNETEYSLGWSIANFLGNPMIFHGGSIDGFTSFAARVPDKHLFVAVLANTDSPEIGVTYLAKTILAASLDIPETIAIEMNDDQLSRYAGSYKRQDGRIWNVILVEGMIYLSPNPNYKQELIPESETSFFMPDAFHTVVFEMDDTGKVLNLSFNLDSGFTIHLVKE